jgi:hypothetical protein
MFLPLYPLIHYPHNFPSRFYGLWIKAWPGVQVVILFSLKRFTLLYFSSAGPLTFTMEEHSETTYLQ